jgi:hypothetical protein
VCGHEDAERDARDEERAVTGLGLHCILLERRSPSRLAGRQEKIGRSAGNLEVALLVAGRGVVRGLPDAGHSNPGAGAMHEPFPRAAPES